MKKVITLSIALMTVLMGCSFSKDSSDNKSVNNVAVLSNPESRFQEEIRFASSEGLSAELKKMSANELNQQFPDGTTPLEVAIERGNISVINLLIKSGASPFIVNKKTNLSPFDEYLLTKKELKSQAFFTARGIAISNSISFTQSQIRHFVSVGLYQDLYNLVIRNNIPASVFLNFFNETSFAERLPKEIIERLLLAPSFENDLTIPQYLRRPHRLFFFELERQLKEALPSFAMLEFISRKTPQNIYGYDHYNSDEDRTYFLNPAVLLEWRNIRTQARHQDKVKIIEKLSNFPAGVAALYCDGSCKHISEAKNSISKDDLKNNERFFNSPLLDNALESRFGAFWDTSDREDTP